ncbi:hypothetical protein [Shewanella pealeana]|uniref:hypothetical protein n=1 Tax=Shewanella pealeana TaxID=70864 RepID=UPI0002F6C74A|nr:hypothetical protein [Shewanella pealeana]
MFQLISLNLLLVSIRVDTAETVENKMRDNLVIELSNEKLVSSARFLVHWLQLMSLPIKRAILPYVGV